MENFKKVNSKFYLTFLIFIVIYFMYSLVVSVSSDTLKGIHANYYYLYIINTTLMFFFKNMPYFLGVFFTFFYSMMISRDNLIMKSGKRVDFSVVISRGLYLLILFTILYFSAIEFFIPYLHRYVGNVRNRSEQALVIVKKAEEILPVETIEEGTTAGMRSLFIDNLDDITGFEIARNYYEQYLRIVNVDDIVEKRLHKVNMVIADWYASKNVPDKLNPPDYLTDYEKLGDYFYEHEDFISAWYYYQYVAEKRSIRRPEIIRRIDRIKEILAIRNSLGTDEVVKKEWMDKRVRQIHEIFGLKQTAESYEDAGDYHEAYFVYKKILDINPNIADVNKKMDDVFSYLKDNAVSVKEIDESRIFNGKEQLSFLINQKTLFLASEAKKIFHFESFRPVIFFYDALVYSFDDDFNVIEIIKSPYGKTISDNSITFYAYSRMSVDLEYFPYYVKVKKSKLDGMMNIYAEADAIDTSDIDSVMGCYSNDGEYYTLREDLNQEDIKEMSEFFFKLDHFFYDNIDDKSGLVKSDNKKLPYVLSINESFFTLYDFTYDYNEVIDFSLFRLFGISDFSLIEETRDFYAGYNKNFIKSVIADKISKLFLFFTINLLLITLAWRHRARYVGFLPLKYIIISPIIFVFVYFFIGVFYAFSTMFQTLMSYAFSLKSMIMINFIFHIIFMTFAIVITASTHVDDE